jgi:hypothetical protein
VITAREREKKKRGDHREAGRAGRERRERERGILIFFSDLPALPTSL